MLTTLKQIEFLEAQQQHIEELSLHHLTCGCEKCSADREYNSEEFAKVRARIAKLLNYLNQKYEKYVQS